MAEKLTPEKLKAAKFQNVLHLNGGRKWSSLIDENEKWSLILTTETDGSPQYRRTARTVSDKGSDAVLDLMDRIDIEKSIAKFCDDYNAARVARLQKEVGNGAD